MTVMGRARAKAAALAVSLALFAATAAAQGTGGTATTLLNQYFLPQNAQISGFSELIFVVVIPVLIVIILMYVGLSRLKAFTDRQAAALSLLLSLFLIPSGGFRIISGVLMGIFGLGNLGPGGISPGGLYLPGFGTITASPEVAATVAFFVLILAAYMANQKLTLTELLMAGMGSTFVWLLMRGNALVALFGFIIFAYIGWKVFETGMATSSLPGYMIGILGLLVLLWAIQSLGFIPESLRQYAAVISGLGMIILVVVILLIIIGFIIVIDCVSRKAGGPPLLPLNPFC